MNDIRELGPDPAHGQQPHQIFRSSPTQLNAKHRPCVSREIRQNLDHGHHAAKIFRVHSLFPKNVLVGRLATGLEKVPPRSPMGEILLIGCAGGIKSGESSKLCHTDEVTWG